MSAPLQTSGKWAKITKANSNITVARALWVGTAGTANLMDEAGTTHADVPLQAGLNPFRCLQVRTGGTADDIWALY